jgi:hypothetical protein
MCITAWLEEERRIVMCLQEEYAIRTKVDAAVESSGMAQTVKHLGVCRAYLMCCFLFMLCQSVQ